MKRPTEYAREFAVLAHGGQLYGDRPYSSHLDAVVEQLRIFGYHSDEQLQVGYLHDVVEDTPTSEADLLKAGFHPNVVGAVLFCTDEEGPNRKTRKARTYQRNALARDQLGGQVSEGHPTLLGIRAKLADRLANILESCVQKSSLLHMYWKERDAFRAAHYLEGSADEMWKAYDHLLRDRPKRN